MVDLFESTNMAPLSNLIESVSPEASPSNPFLIHVCGPSASGKSTLSRQLCNTLTDGTYITMDRYLSEGLWDTTRTFNHESPDPTRPHIGGISPEIWDMALMEAQLLEIKNGNPVRMPIFDETIKDRAGYDDFQPSARIMVEGGHSFSSPFVEMADFKVLVDAPLHGRLVRKLVRTCLAYGLDEGDEILGRYLTKDEPIHRHYMDERTAMADAILSNPLRPAREFNVATSHPETESAPPHHTTRLLPKVGTGTLLPEEELAVDQTNKELVLSYHLLGKRVVSTVIASSTLDLILNFYDEEGIARD